MQKENKWHAVATRTVHPTLKSAREFNERPQPPQILHTDTDPSGCYAALLSISGGRDCNSVELCMNGLPMFVTPDWTYYIIDG